MYYTLTIRDGRTGDILGQTCADSVALAFTQARERLIPEDTFPLPKHDSDDLIMSLKAGINVRVWGNAASRDIQIARSPYPPTLIR